MWVFDILYKNVSHLRLKENEAAKTFTAFLFFDVQLETSTTFFKALQDSTILPAVLDQICSADAETCIGIMDNYAKQIDQSSTCK